MKRVVNKEFEKELLDAMPSLKAYAASLLGKVDGANDLVQETMLKAWSHHTDFIPGTNMRAWLYTILRNEFYSRMRKKGREVEDVDGAYSSFLSTHAPQDGVLALNELKEALGLLPKDMREALLQVAIGHQYEDTAQMQSVAMGTIKSRVHRARAILADMLENGLRRKTFVWPPVVTVERQPVAPPKPVKLKPAKIVPSPDLVVVGMGYRLWQSGVLVGGQRVQVFELVD